MPYKGNYTLYKVENYSIYVPQRDMNINPYQAFNIKKYNIKKYLPGIIIIIIATIIFVYAIRNKEPKIKNKEENMPEATKLNK